jgi:hypothetical protein
VTIPRPGLAVTRIPADNGPVESLTVECLRCGHTREVDRAPRRADTGSCPRCEYVGWAYSADLTERTRKLVRELPLERRLFLRPI